MGCNSPDAPGGTAVLRSADGRMPELCCECFETIIFNFPGAFLSSGSLTPVSLATPVVNR